MILICSTYNFLVSSLTFVVIYCWYAETSLWFPFKLYFSGCWKSGIKYRFNWPKSWVRSRVWQEKPSHGPSSCTKSKWRTRKGIIGLQKVHVTSIKLCFWKLEVKKYTFPLLYSFFLSSICRLTLLHVCIYLGNWKAFFFYKMWLFQQCSSKLKWF